MKNTVSIFLSVMVGCLIGLFIGINFLGKDSKEESIFELDNGTYNVTGDWATPLEAKDNAWVIGESNFKVIYGKDNTVFLIGDKNNLVYNAKEVGDKIEFRKITKEGILETPVAVIEKQ